jgi:general secretion pathway protein C
MLSLYDNFNGYQLTEIFPKYVIFSKDGTNYKLMLDGIKEEEDTKEVQIKNKTTKTKQQVQAPTEDKVYSVKRSDMNSYLKNFDRIWRDISIMEIKSNGSTNGFKVTRIRPRALFYKVGLRSGDIIKAVNGKELLSYADAFEVYNKIKSINSLYITIIRNNITMELEYEIK